MGEAKHAIMESAQVRSELADALELDLVGPNERLGSPAEILPQSPSRWYLTGFLVPLDAEEAQRVDEDGTDELDTANDAGGADDARTPEPASARQRYRPSSIGLSVLVPAALKHLKVAVRWGDYKRRKQDEDKLAPEEWERTQRTGEVVFDVPATTGNRARRRLREATGSKWSSPSAR